MPVTHRTMCPMNCHPTYCGMLVEIEDGRVTGIRGDGDNPDSRGFLCVRGRAAAQILGNPARILTPRVRDRHGSGAWRVADWDTALDQVAAAVRSSGPEHTAVWAGHGVFGNGLGGQLSARFAHMTGCQWWNPSIVCWGLGGLGFFLTGVTEVNTMDDMAAHSDLIILWGANLASQPNTGPRLAAARRRGARVVAIDIRRTEAFAQADETIIIRPGTDTALALAMQHVIITEGQYDRDFVREHATGFAELAEHIRPFTPAWAETETGIPAARITNLARAYAATKQSLILAGGSSMHKSGNGWRAARAIACLPALTGALGRPGGGLGPRHAAQSHGAGTNRVVPADTKAPESVIPSEMHTILEALEAGRITTLILLGTNMLSSFADSERVARAMARMECVAAFDLFENETIRSYAGVVFPGTAWLEETGFKSGNTHVYLMDQALPPAGEARPVWQLLDGLATRLGVADFFPWKDADGLVDAILDHPTTGHVTTGRLRAQEGRQPLAVSPVGHPDLRFATPSGAVEFASPRAAALGLPVLPDYAPAEENHVTAPEAARYPLVFTQGRTIAHFHGFYDHGRALPALVAAEPAPLLWIHPDDAAARGVQDGTRIRAWNDRGELPAVASVTERVPPGVVWMHDGWEGVNRLTSGARAVPDAAAIAFPAGSAAYEARVEVACQYEPD